MTTDMSMTGDAVVIGAGERQELLRVTENVITSAWERLCNYYGCLRRIADVVVTD